MLLLVCVRGQHMLWGAAGGERTTSDLPVSTSAPPASARTTQDSPAQAGTAVGTTAGISKPSGQPSSIAEDNTSAKAAAQKAATGMLADGSWTELIFLSCLVAVS